MASYYRATCQTEYEAISAHRCSRALFDSVGGATSMAWKRSGVDVLYCFEDPAPIVSQLTEILRTCGLFEHVGQIDATDFDQAKSNSV